MKVYYTLFLFLFVCNGFAQIQITGTVTNATCHGFSDGSVNITVSGGVPPYSYNWGVSTTEDLTNVSAGSYTVSVADANGGLQTKSFTVNEPVPFTVEVTADDTFTTCPPLLVQFTATSTGGTPLTYDWSYADGDPHSFSSTPTHLFRKAGLFIASLIATDNNGCIAKDSVAIHAGTPIDVILSDTIICRDSTFNITVDVHGAPKISSMIMYDGSMCMCTSLSYAYTTIGDKRIQVIVSDSNFCQVVFDYTVHVNDVCYLDSVYPGDADYNGLVDNNDLLALGFAYDSAGSARIDTSIGWYAHDALDWNGNSFGTSNRKHADCNGSGQVERNDTFAILQNYAAIHNKTNDSKPHRNGLPELWVDIPQGLYHFGEELTASIYLADSALLVNGFYGVAFTLNYDNTLVESGKTEMNFNAPWMGALQEKISIAKDFAALGQMKTAVTRIHRTGVNGYGKIGEIKVKLKATVGQSDSSDFRLFISDVKALNINGEEIQLNEGADTALVINAPNAIEETKADLAVTLFPNPAKNRVYLRFRETTSTTVQLYDALGVQIQTFNTNSKEMQVATESLPTGVYYFIVTCSDKSTVRKQFTVVR